VKRKKRCEDEQTGPMISTLATGDGSTKALGNDVCTTSRRRRTAWQQRFAYWSIKFSKWGWAHKT